MIKRTRFPIMMKAIDLLSELSDDPVVRERAWIREKRLHDEASIIDSAKYKGRKEGMAIGIKKGKAEGAQEERSRIAAKMRAAGLSEEQIREFLYSSSI